MKDVRSQPIIYNPSPLGRETGQTLDPIRQSKNSNWWVEVKVVNLGSE
jgi:hypothetical protein